MIYKNIPELTPAERALPISKYYDIPLDHMGPLYQQLIDTPLKEEDCIPIEHWLDHLSMPGEYKRPVFGYRIMDEGKYGYIASYCHYPNGTPQMMSWYFRWINILSRNQPRDQGNLRYKLWCPAGHWTHEFINGKDKTDGIMSQESIDMNELPGYDPDSEHIYTVRYPIDLSKHGFTEEMAKMYRDAGIWIDANCIKFYTDDGKTPILGSHVMLTMSRPCALGGMEKYSAEWVGYGEKDGELYCDPSTPNHKISNEWMKLTLTHGIVEAQHLSKFLPELYAEYRDKSDYDD